MTASGRAPDRRAGAAVRRLLLLSLLASMAALAWALGLFEGAATARRAPRASRSSAAEADEARGSDPPAPVPGSAAEADPAPFAPAPAPAADPEPPPPGTVTGTVRLPEGRSPEGAVVVVAREGAPDERREARPDPLGRVWMDRLAPGRYRLRATHEDYAPRAFSFDVSEAQGAGPFDIVMVEGGTVRVRVLDAKDAPAQRRRIELRLFDSREPDEIAHTDANGEALFERLAAGYYWVLCGEKDLGSHRDVRVEPGQTSEVLFDLSCGLLGTVFDASGAPLPGVGVRLHPVAHGSDDLLVLAETDELGRFELLGVRPGEYRPRVGVYGPGGYYVTLEPVVLAAGERKRHDLRVPSGGLAGRVTRDTGEPFGDTRVLVRACPVEVADGAVTRRLGYYPGWLTPDGWSAEYLARADAEGRFRLPGLPPGHYEVWVIASERPLAIDRRLVQVPGTEGSADFVLQRRPAGKVRVRALEPDGTPATGLLFSETVIESVTVLLQPRQVGDGIYELDLHVGPHTIFVYRVRSWSQRIDVEIAEDATVERVVKAR